MAAKHSKATKADRKVWGRAAEFYFSAIRKYNWWELTFFTVGLIAFIGLFAILFLPLGKGPQEPLPNGTMPPAGSADFLKTISQSMTLPLDRGEPIAVLENGDGFVTPFLTDIDKAQKSIDIMVYIWRDGRFSDTVLEHLQQKQQAGVQVRVIYDAYGGLHAPRGKFKKLQDAGGKVAVFNSLIPMPWTIARAPKRNHRRAMVIDGKIAYTGGIAFDDVWLGNASNPAEWHDLTFRVTGDMAARLQGSFAEIWSAATGEMLLGDAFFPPVDQQAGTIPFMALSTSPSPDLYESETFLLLSLLGARNSIEIETPYFLPDASFRKVLMDKARSGVSITILVPNEHTDEKSVRWASQRIYGELMDAGIKIYEFQPTFTHTKLLVEDGIYSVIGSANLDNRSRKINDEVVLAVNNDTLAGTLHSIYLHDLSRSKKIDAAAWAKRGLWQRILEIACQAFVQQY